MAAPRPDGAQAARAMAIALRSAGVTPDDIDFVSPHGSSTPLNDTTETRALKSVLGERAYAIPISASKPYHAHALGASGAIEAAICCLAMQHHWLPPTLNQESRDDDCDLDYVPNYGRNVAPRTALSNSFGFGGINAALVLRHA
jgi:3-oxoacyl-[acyl-carrier-protein] synthase II